MFKYIYFYILKTGINDLVIKYNCEELFTIIDLIRTEGMF